MMDTHLYGLTAYYHENQLRAFVARSDGLYTACDDLAQWTKATYTPPAAGLPEAVTAICSVAQGSEMHIFAATQGGILRSSNHGQDWFFAALTAPPPVVSCLLPSPAFVDEGLLLVGTLEDGICRSEDYGRSWSPSGFGLLDRHVLVLAFAGQEDIVYAGTETGVFVSHNAGRSWRETHFPMEAAPVLSLAALPSGELLAGTERSGLYASSDQGQTWLRQSETAFTEAINQLLYVRGRLYALHGDQLWSAQDTQSDWLPQTQTNQSITTAAALLDQRLLLGFDDGRSVILPLSD